MTTHGFESLGDVLKRLGVNLDVETDGDVPDDYPFAECARCNDSGWLRHDVPASHSGFGRVVECPCGLIQTRRMQRMWHYSEIPVTMRHYTLESFVDRSGKRELADDIQRVWDDTERWLLLCGPVGVGKTGIAISLLLQMTTRMRSGLYVVTPTFLSRIRSTYGKDASGDERDVMEVAIQSKILVLDDLGKVALTEWGQEKLFTLINERYLAGNRTVITSNLDTEDGSLEAHLWPATWDRIRGMSEIFRLTGESLR